MVLTKPPLGDQPFCQESSHVLQEVVTKIRVIIGTILTNELQLLKTNVLLHPALRSKKKCGGCSGLVVKAQANREREKTRAEI